MLGDSPLNPFSSCGKQIKGRLIHLFKTQTFIYCQASLGNNLLLSDHNPIYYYLKTNEQILSHLLREEALLHSYSPGGSIQQNGWSRGARWLLQLVVPLSLRAFHCHAQPSGGTAAGGGVPAMGQVRHTRRAGVLRAVTCKHTGITNQIISLSWQHS